MGALPKDVRIVCTAKKAVVVPAYRDVKRGEAIQFFAVTGSVTLFFPRPDLFTPPKQSLAISPGSPGMLTINPEAEVGTHPYAAFCNERNEFAEGASPPTMIIE